MKKPYTLDLKGTAEDRDKALEEMIRVTRKDEDGATYFADVGGSDVLQVYTNDRLEDVRSRLIALRPDLSDKKAEEVKPKEPVRPSPPNRYQRPIQRQPVAEDDEED